MHRNHHLHYHFFKNKEINAIYVSVFVMNLAETMISVFVPIYLYHLHYSVVKIIFFFLISHIGSVALALPAANLVSKFGSKHSILFSTPFAVLYFLGLKILPAYPALFYLLPLLITLRGLFYNFGFDLNYIKHLNRKKIGFEISLMHTLAIFASVLAPLVAGILIMSFGYHYLFTVGSMILLLSLLPLFLQADTYEKINFTWRSVVGEIFKKKNFDTTLSYSGYAIESSVGRVIWPVFLMIVLGSAGKVGYLVTVSAFITMIVLFLVGQIADKLHLGKLIRFGTMLYFFGWVGSMFADSALRAFFAEAYRTLSGRFVLVPWAAAFYRSISPSTYFRSVVLRDIIFNGSRIVILPLIMVIFAINISPFVISFAIASYFTLLYALQPDVKQA